MPKYLDKFHNSRTGLTTAGTLRQEREITVDARPHTRHDIAPGDHLTSTTTNNHYLVTGDGNITILRSSPRAKSYIVARVDDFAIVTRSAQQPVDRFGRGGDPLPTLIASAAPVAILHRSIFEEVTRGSSTQEGTARLLVPSSTGVASGDQVALGRGVNLRVLGVTKGEGTDVLTCREI